MESTELARLRRVALHEVNACFGRRNHQNPECAARKPAAVSARFLESDVVCKLLSQDLPPLGMQVDFDERLVVIELYPRIRRDWSVSSNWRVISSCGIEPGGVGTQVSFSPRPITLIR
jgi:hypothetical protein